jgi:hypothetical protein
MGHRAYIDKVLVIAQQRVVEQKLENSESVTKAIYYTAIIQHVTIDRHSIDIMDT